MHRLAHRHFERLNVSCAHGVGHRWAVHGATGADWEIWKKKLTELYLLSSAV